MRRLTTLLATVAMLVGVLAAPALANDDARDTADPAFAETSEPSLTLGELLVEEGPGGFDRVSRDYDVIRNIVLAILGDETVTTNLGAALDPNAELTLFIPQDRAFQRLVYELTGQWLPESEIIGAVLGAGFSLQDVNDIVENHVFAGVIPASAALQSDGATLTAVGGGEITVDVKWGRWIRLIDDARPYPWVLDTDNFGTNGVFHGISQVIVSS